MAFKMTFMLQTAIKRPRKAVPAGALLSCAHYGFPILDMFLEWHKAARVPTRNAQSDCKFLVYLLKDAKATVIQLGF